MNFNRCCLQLLLIATFVITKSRCELHQSLRCENPIPGYEKLQFGIDATEVDLMSCPDVPGKRGQIFDYNWCSENRVYRMDDIKDYRTGNFTSYRLPDILDVKHMGKLGNGTHMINDFKQCREFLLKNVHFSEKGDKKGIMSSSQTLKKYQAAFDEGYQVIVNHIQYLSPVLHLMVYNEQRDLGKYTVDTFKNAIELLPNKFEGNEDEFIKFINQYGTHFITGVAYGATIHRLALIKNKTNFDEVKDKVSVSFPSISDKDKPICIDSNSTNIVVFKNYELNYEHVFLGGNTSLSLNGNYTKWAPSAVSIRTPNHLILEPISRIVKDEKSKAVQDAVDSYLAGAYLNETIRSLKKLNQNVKKMNYTNTEATSILRSAAYTNSSTFYDITTLNELTNRAEYEITQMKLYISNATMNQEKTTGNIAQNVGTNVLLHTFIMTTIIIRYV